MHRKVSEKRLTVLQQYCTRRFLNSISLTSAVLAQVMAEGTRKTVSELLASSAPKIAANLQKRRLIPFKSLPTQMGTVAALTYCLKQHPTLLTLGVVRSCCLCCMFAKLLSTTAKCPSRASCPPNPAPLQPSTCASSMQLCLRLAWYTLLTNTLSARFPSCCRLLHICARHQVHSGGSLGGHHWLPQAALCPAHVWHGKIFLSMYPSACFKVAVKP